MSGTSSRRRRKTPPATVSLEEGRALIAASENEETLLQFVLQTARTHGWLTYHTRRSDRSDKGFYDVVAMHPIMMRVVLAELKTTRGRFTDEQKAWAAAAESIADAWASAMPYRDERQPLQTAVFGAPPASYLQERRETWPLAYYEWRPAKTDKDEILKVFEWKRR